MSLPQPDQTVTSRLLNEYNMTYLAQLFQSEDMSLSSMGDPEQTADPYLAQTPLSYEDSGLPPAYGLHRQGLSPMETGRKHTETPGVVHEYRRIPDTEDDKLDQCVQTCKSSDPDRMVFRCIWPGCTVVPFTVKCQAYVHVRKHLGIRKLYECVVW